MPTDVLTGYVGQEFLVAEAFRLQHQATFVSMNRRSEPSGAKEQAQFEGHVETRKVMDRVALNSRYAMNAEMALIDKV